ncbi:P-loop containing nucleoside triphosphate hydrolase protein, partial [Hygrophoropsis aurantiaca]
MPYSTARAADKSIWLSLERRVLIRGIIEERLPQWRHGPHEFQVDSWAHSLAGISQLLIVPTGGGKTGVFFGLYLVVDALLKKPVEGISCWLPESPVVMIVTPLNALGDTQAAEMCALGIRAVSINMDTVRKAREEKRDLLDEIRRCKWSITIWSPEKLTSNDTEAVLRDEYFLSNIIMLGVDETHVLPVWEPAFRAAYRQIGLLHKRLPAHVPLVAVTATLVPGPDEIAVCRSLGLVPGHFHYSRHSCERLNIREVVRELTHGLSGSKFPDIAWVLDNGEKVLIYCQTIELGFRVAVYLWNLLPPGPQRLDIVRLWNSLTSNDYNNETLELFDNNPETRAIICTLAFGMGINRRNITKVINLGVPKSLNEDKQQKGRAGRDLESPAVGYTYVEPSVMKQIRGGTTRDIVDDIAVDYRASEGVSGANPRTDVTMAKKKTAKTKGKQVASSAALKPLACQSKVEPNMARVLRAHVNGVCLNSTINGIYDNPGEVSRKDCIAAQRPFPCSSCDPLWDHRPLMAPDLNPPPSSESSLAISKSKISVPATLSKVHREYAKAKLEYFAAHRWNLKDAPRFRIIPPCSFWTGKSLQIVLDNFHLIRSLESLASFLPGWEFFDADGAALLELMEKLNQRFDRRMNIIKTNRIQKGLNTRKKNANLKAA